MPLPEIPYRQPTQWGLTAESLIVDQPVLTLTPIDQITPQ